MKMSKNKPIKSFEIVYLGVWYFVEIFNFHKIEIYTENKEDIEENYITSLINYIKEEGFLDSIIDK